MTAKDRRLLVIVPRPVPSEQLGLRQAQLESVALGHGFRFGLPPRQGRAGAFPKPSRLPARGPAGLRGCAPCTGRGLRCRLHRHHDGFRCRAAAFRARHPGHRSWPGQLSHGVDAGSALLHRHHVGRLESVIPKVPGRTAPRRPVRLDPCNQRRARWPQPAHRQGGSGCCRRSRRPPGAASKRTAPTSSAWGRRPCTRPMAYLRDRLPVPVVNPGPLT